MYTFTLWNKVDQFHFKFNVLLIHIVIFRPVFVFDGRTPEIKKKTIAKRKKLIKSSSKRYQKTLENVILSQFGLTSLEQLKDMIKNKENIHNFNSIDEHDDELIHLLCNEIESDDEVNIEEEIDYEIDSEEFLMLDEESKLSSLHKAKKHQKKVSKEMIATEFASDHSPVCLLFCLTIFNFSFNMIIFFRINIPKYKFKIS